MSLGILGPNGDENWCLNHLVYLETVTKKKKNIPPLAKPILVQAMLLIEDYSDAAAQGEGSHESYREPKMACPQQCHQNSPPVKILKINVDNATRNPSAVAAIICNHFGAFRRGLSKILLSYTVEEAATWGFLLGLKLVQEQYQGTIIIEGDCMQVVQLFYEVSTNPL